MSVELFGIVWTSECEEVFGFTTFTLSLIRVGTLTLKSILKTSTDFWYYLLIYDLYCNQISVAYFHPIRNDWVLQIGRNMEFLIEITEKLCDIAFHISSPLR